MRAWRITKSKHVATAFDGEGARQHGSRWSSPGVRVCFASETVALATLEILVHLQDGLALGHYSSIEIRFPEALVERLDVASLPGNWRSSPAPSALAAIGGLWVSQSRSALLAVPSAVTGTEENFLINPAHPDFKRIRIESPRAYPLDPRLAS